MPELIRLLNHPAMPWPAGGVIGGILGQLLGTPDCDAAGPCQNAAMPLFDVPFTQDAWTATGALVGTLVGGAYWLWKDVTKST